MNNFQQFCIDEIVHIINTYNGDDYTDKCYQQIIKDLINLYAVTYENKFSPINHQHIIVWKEELNAANKFHIAKNLLLSQNARQIWLNQDAGYLKNKISLSKNIPITEKIHIEHITPNNYIYQKINNLIGQQVTFDDIKQCFSQHKPIILTKEESNYFDGKNMKFNMQDYFKIKELDIPYNLIEEAEDICYNQLSCSENGFGILRIIHLLNYKPSIKIVNINNDEQSLMDIFNYLTNDTYTLY